MKTSLLVVVLTTLAWGLRAQTPQLVADINPGPIGRDPSQTTVYDGKLYFAAPAPLLRVSR